MKHDGGEGSFGAVGTNQGSSRMLVLGGEGGEKGGGGRGKGGSGRFRFQEGVVNG